MKLRIRTDEPKGNSLEDVFSSFIVHKAACNNSPATLNNYQDLLRTLRKYIDVTAPLEDLTKRKLDGMVVLMRQGGLANNSIATYVRLTNTFLAWCREEGLTTIQWHNIQEQETVIEIYSDEELARLLKRPPANCQFTIFRSWVIICFLMNCGCRAASVRAVLNKDVDLDKKQVTLRHTKTKKIQVVPLCSQMIPILKEYMMIRKGKQEDFLFCDQYGDQLSESALRQSIARYNRARRVSKTSIHAFRHTFAHKYLVDCHGNALMLQKILGHSTLRMTRRYCDLFDQDIAKGFDENSPLAQILVVKKKIQK